MKLKIVKIIIGLIVSALLLWGFSDFLLEYSQDPQIISMGQKLIGFKIYSQKGLNITLGSIFLSLFLIAISFKVSQVLSQKVVPKVLSPVVSNEGVMATIKTLSFYLFLVLFVIFAFSISNIPLTVFTLFGGALAIGLGFGSQNVVSNFISGLILQFERPMKVGDIISIDGSVGKVMEIGGRSTKLLTGENTHVVIPNSSFLEKQFVNWTLENYIIRGTVNVGFDYKHPPQDIKAFLLNIATQMTGVLETPKTEVLVTDFGPTAVNYQVQFWIYIQNPRGRQKMESDLRELIFEAALKENYFIPHGFTVVAKKD